jgi:hypothetical protein
MIFVHGPERNGKFKFKFYFEIERFWVVWNEEEEKEEE